MEIEELILTELRKRAREIEYGTIVIEYKIQDRKIISADLVETRVRIKKN